MEEIQPFAFENLGHVPLTPDPRDFSLGLLPAPEAVPAQLMPPEFFALAPMMQAKQPACGGFSLAQLGTYEGEGVLSPRFAYMAEKNQDGLPGIDGTTSRGIGQAAKSVGVCLDSLMPDDVTLPFPEYADMTKASPEANADAAGRKASSYFFLHDLSMQGIKTAIAQNKAVILDVQVGSEWWTAPDGTVSWKEADVLPVRPPKQIVSGHFIVCGAYEEDRIWFVNSWSGAWGKGGFGYLTEDYMPYVAGGIALAEITPEQKAQIVKVIQATQTLVESAKEQPPSVQQHIAALAEKVAQFIKQMLS